MAVAVHGDWQQKNLKGYKMPTGKVIEDIQDLVLFDSFFLH